jgi:hypothetical protein
MDEWVYPIIIENIYHDEVTIFWYEKIKLQRDIKYEVPE